MRVGVPAVYSTCAILFAAKELGYHKDRNLKVDIIQFRGRPATQEALAARSIDISAIRPGAASLAIAKAVPDLNVRVIARLVPFQTGIMVRNENPREESK